MEAEKVAGTVDCSMKNDLREEHPRPLASEIGYEMKKWDA